MGKERQWFCELIHLSLAAASNWFKADAAGLAIGLGGRKFLHYAFNNRLETIDETKLNLPEPLLEKISGATLTLKFPETVLLPLNPPLGSAMLSGKSNGKNFLLVFWVGKFQQSNWTESEIKGFEGFGKGLTRIFIPAFPTLIDKNVIRSWLEISTKVDAKVWFEEGLSCLLDLLLFAAGKNDGAIVLTDMAGKPLFGVAKGEYGLKCLNIQNSPLTLNRSFAVRVFSVGNWKCLIAVKVQPQFRSRIFRLMEAETQIISSIVSWLRCSTKLEFSPWIDPLTKLPNKRAFMERLESELNRASRLGYPVSLILADLDEFRTFNEILGREKANQILKEIGSIFRQSVRSYDLVARYGDDEFALILPAASLDNALAVAERLRDKLAGSEILTVKDVKLDLKVSFGLTTAQKVYQKDLSRFLSLADQALSVAKAKGGNRIEVAVSSDFIPSTGVLPPMPSDLWSVLVQYLSHSINNPLNGILGMTQIALMDERLPSNVREALEQVEKSSIRLREFIRYIMNLPPKRIVEELEAFWQRMRAIPSSRGE
ncbi:MAG: diguanylate cyclase [Armatimonadetes bacterium]|nr:diguanylate cyclase [Armatimonadota bacterium]MDW8026810.1 diguanylate cyclase [Armatimonadota bacterium]